MALLRIVASFLGLVASIGSPIVAAMIILSTACMLIALGRRELVLGKLVPTYAAGRIVLHAIADE